MFREPIQYVIELDNAVYSLKESNLSSVKDLKEINGNKRVISDLHDTVSRTVNVQAPQKYAEIVVRKKLLDSGELDGTAAVFTHWKKQNEGMATDVFFTAMPSRLVEHNFDRIKKDEGCVLLFPLYTVLYAALKDISPEEPIAVMFQHNRFVDLIIGTKEKIYHAHRCTIPDQQNVSMWDMAFSEIAAAEGENSISVDKYYLLTWIDSIPLPELSEKIRKKLFFFEEEPVMYNDEIYHISFTRAVRMLKASGPCCISPLTEKISCYSEKCLPILTLFLFICTLFLAGGYFFYNQRSKHLGKTAAELKNKMSLIRSEINKTDAEIDHKDTLKFVQSIYVAKRSLPYKKIINDVSSILSEDMNLDSMNLDYRSESVRASISGRIELPFDSARKEYQSFIKKLKKMKYKIRNDDFKVKVNKYNFNVIFEKQV
jgi:hypothetical protein